MMSSASDLEDRANRISEAITQCQLRWSRRFKSLFNFWNLLEILLRLVVVLYIIEHEAAKSIIGTINYKRVSRFSRRKLEKWLDISIWAHRELKLILKQKMQINRRNHSSSHFERKKKKCSLKLKENKEENRLLKHNLIKYVI